MDEDKIKALGREYAEEHVITSCFSQITYEELLEDQAEIAAYVIRWLSSRFCIVEKSKVQEEYKDAQKDQHNQEKDFALTIAGRNRSAVLVDLFPEVVKEINHE